ncbi:hypothetical protein VNO78_00979 [Psophocarpus tetragonolobus]|uniref:Uncharacterized protein n=1 Tax=Psophocarpus tetragonolobus TaxID=3891 RepID=A0AAN9SXX2_PSOTE
MARKRRSSSNKHARNSMAERDIEYLKLGFPHISEHFLKDIYLTANFCLCNATSILYFIECNADDDGLHEYYSNLHRTEFPHLHIDGSIQHLKAKASASSSSNSQPANH